MDARARESARTTPVVIALIVLACALLTTVAGAVLSIKLWQNLPQSQAATLEQTQIQTLWAALLRGAPTAAREGTAIADGARELMPAIAPRPSAAPQIGPRLRNAMAAPSTQAGRLLIIAAILAQAESEGRPPEQAWTAIKPYIDSSPTAPYQHFAAAREVVLGQVYCELSIRDGTAASLANVGPELLSPFLQFFVPRMRALEQARLVADDPVSAELCRKAARRVLREWTLEAGPVGTRLTAADLLARELATDSANATLVEALRAWRKAYRDSARQRPTPSLGVGGDDPNLCPTEHAALVGSMATSLWLLVSTLLSGLVAIGFVWAILRDVGELRNWRSLAVGGLVAIATIVSAGMVIQRADRAVQDDLRGLMVRASAAKPAKAKRCDTWHPAYRAQLLWAAAGWTLAALAVGALAGAALHAPNRFAGAAVVLTVAWAFIAATWVAQCAWGFVRLTRYETALSDAYRKGVYAAVAGDSAEKLLDPVRDWRP